MNNPSAFPLHPEHWQEENQGMTLRDYFAAKAMQSMIPFLSINDELTIENIRGNNFARDSYAVADAMLKAREA
jgi:hypothetical protein